jgi:hypothetical protein
LFKLLDYDNVSTAKNKINKLPDKRRVNYASKSLSNSCKFSSTQVQRKTVKILQLNTRSIGNKFEEIEIFFELHKPDIICISEHWQSYDSISSFCFNNYYLANSFCRSVNKHGGVAIFIKNEININKIPTIDELSLELHCEVTAVELVHYKTVVISLYHSPPPNGNRDTFLDRLHTVLSLCKNGYNIILAGDFNINFIFDSNSSKMLKELLNCFNIKPLFSSPTREHQASYSCIDNIVTDLPPVTDSVFSIDTGFSDHKAQLCKLKLNCNKTDKTVDFKLSRKFTASNYETFRCLLSKVSWEEVDSAVNVNTKFDLFHDILTTLFQEAFPLTKNRTFSFNGKFWITPGIKVSSNRLKLLRIEKNRNNGEAFNAYFKNYKRIFYKVCRAAKRNTYDNYVRKSTGNRANTLWNFIKSKTGNFNEFEQITLRKDGNKISNPIHVANEFNRYFDGITHNLDSGSISSDPEPIQPPTTVCQTFYLSPLSESDLQLVLLSFKNRKSVGFDAISCDIILKFKDFIITPLLNIINESFSQGTFPDRLKLGVIRPLHKRNSKTDPANYRPICTLSTFSKIFEKCFILKLLHFLNRHNVIIKEQHGFVEGRSTTTALFDFINKIHDRIDRGNLTSGIFFDLTKAFDLINHEILLRKIERYGIRGLANKWLCSYLSNRKQVVEIKTKSENVTYTVSSQSLKTSAGVIQGSIIGPLLFILFVNDIPTLNVVDQRVLFADDISVVVSEKMTTELNSKTDLAIRQICEWAHYNKLRINFEKSLIMNFYNRTPFEENLESELQVVHTFKLLGITLDQRLNWTDHVDRIASKISSFCFLLRRLRDYCGLPTLRTVYFAYVQSICSYGVMFWGNSSYSCRILKLQKWAVRTILGLSKRHSCAEHFKDLRILTVPALYILSCYKFVLKNKKVFFGESRGPSSGSGRNMRHRSRIDYPIHKTGFYEKGPFYQCVRIFNRLPQIYQKIDNEKELIKMLKEQLIKAAPYTLNDFFNDCV